MKNFNIKKRFLESSFLKVLKNIKKNPTTYIYTIVLDFIFLALIIFIGKYMGSFIPTDPQQIMALFKTQTNLLLFTIIYPIIYYLFITFIYSVIKLSILNLINKKRKFTLNGLGKFYLLNIILLVIIFFTALILLGIFAIILKRDFVSYLSLILLIPFFFFAYSIINISHTLFIQNHRDKIIKASFNITFKKINKYSMFIVWNIGFVLIYLLLYNIVNIILKFLIFTNQEAIAAYGPTYLNILNIVSMVIIYLIIAFNRIYFYERIDKNVLQ